MTEIILKEPTLEYAEDIWKFRQEIIDSDDKDKFAGCGNLEECSSAEEWINTVKIWRVQETCPGDRVPSNVYIAVRSSDNKIVGITDLRHHIDHPVLSAWGGHIGYYVRSDERCKGYAAEMLRQNLLNCRSLGIERVLISCDADNRASEKTILANGGVFEREVEVNGEMMKRFWITCGRSD